jgi:hypothetical protein
MFALCSLALAVLLLVTPPLPGAVSGARGRLISRASGAPQAHSVYAERPLGMECLRVPIGVGGQPAAQSQSSEETE